MHTKLLFCLIFASLCTSFVSFAQQGSENRGQSVNDAQVLSAICELRAWNASSLAQKNSLLLAKAQLLSGAGQAERAFAAVCRVPLFGLSESERVELCYLKLQYAYEASKFSDFAALLSEALSTGSLLEDDIVAIQNCLARKKLRRKNPDVAMLLSILPGLGNAYAGDYANAGKYFLAEGAIIATGVGAFLSGLYISAFAGGGMLLYSTLPVSTSKALTATTAWNNKALKDYYAPVYKIICGR